MVNCELSMMNGEGGRQKADHSEQKNKQYLFLVNSLSSAGYFRVTTKANFDS